MCDNTSTVVVQAEREREGEEGRGGCCLAALAQAELPSPRAKPMEEAAVLPLRLPPSTRSATIPLVSQHAVWTLTLLCSSTMCGVAIFPLERRECEMRRTVWHMLRG